MKAKHIIAELRQENDKLRQVLTGHADQVTQFLRACGKEEYMDTGDAEDLLRRIRSGARRAARKPRMTPEGVYVHGVGADGNHANEDEGIVGWCVYTRYQSPNGEFDIRDEQDFKSQPAARKEAKRRARLLDVPVEEY